jgi:hypothetical protein
VDSILPIGDHLQRFRLGLDSLGRFTPGGAASPEELVGHFLARVAAGDSVALVRMALSRREFAWVYYPRHVYSAAPYELDPGTFWTLISLNSGKGLPRLLTRFRGRRLAYRNLACNDTRTVRAPLGEWRCTVLLEEDGAAIARRLFGSIVSDGTTYKFGGFGNDL